MSSLPVLGQLVVLFYIYNLVGVSKAFLGYEVDVFVVWFGLVLVLPQDAIQQCAHDAAHARAFRQREAAAA